MRKPWLLLVCAAALGCGREFRRPPASGLAARNIRSIALRPIVNKTQQAGLEDQLFLRVRDEFLRDGRCALLPEKEADAVVLVTMTRYLNTPIQYDATMSPTAYKLDIMVDLELAAREKPEPPLFQEKNLEGLDIYAAANLTGGLNEAQAREGVWDTLARDIVARVVEGPGAAAAAPAR